jgi:hypothetical protein
MLRIREVYLRSEMFKDDVLEMYHRIGEATRKYKGER